MKMRFVAIAVLSLMILLCGTVSSVFANELATLTGRITDTQGLVVAEVKVEATNINTNVSFSGETNAEGLYRIVSLPPGTYRVIVQKTGFAQVAKPGVELHVQDVITINFTMKPGSISETVTVESGAPLVNTTDASVSTLVDHKFVESMPLNGRSFQDLILLTPGVVTNSPQSPTGLGATGEFSVNGQRTESNYYTVDGVSASLGIQAGNPGGAPASTGGAVASSTALGTTQALVSVDALQEFRVQSSTYSAEYGRSPGGQFSLVTRSGTNQWHGTAFDYLRNDVFDANDWFNNFLGQPRPALRQNDFGGTVAGPAMLPGAHDATKNKTFVFFSYEGLRLMQPQAASISDVPTDAFRQSAPAALQPVLNAFPVVNCTAAMPNCVADLGDGMGNFVGTWSNPAQLDAYSVRLDHAFSDKLKLFFRFGGTSSNTVQRLGGSTGSIPSNPLTDSLRMRTYTLGASSLISTRVSNDLRFSYGSNEDVSSSRMDNFGGAQGADLFQLQGFPSSARSAVQLTLGYDALFPSIIQQNSSGTQRQWNIVDTVSVSRGKHEFKFGVDFRRFSPIQHQSSPVVIYEYDDPSSVTSNSVDFGLAQSSATVQPTFINFSAFAQDEWRVAPRLTLSMGLRWEVNPAPGAADGKIPFTVQGAGDLATATLAPQGTPLWSTTWYNFAPRLGAAYVLRNKPGFETVVRGGGGVFFDTGQQLGSFGYLGPGFNAQTFFGSCCGPAGSFPLPPSQTAPPILIPPDGAPWSTVVAYYPHLQLPFTLQWNASIQQSLGRSQALTVSYVGSNARRLLQINEVFAAAFNPNFSDFVLFEKNGQTADYNSLQLQYQRRLSRGLQALASYTWGHSIDYGSQNLALPIQRGNSDSDVRHSLSGALSYELPEAYHGAIAGALLHHWGLDSRFTARTGFPIPLSGGQSIDPATGQVMQTALDVVEGQSLYLYGPQFPGGRSINPCAFVVAPNTPTAPCSGTVLGPAPRNFARGFGAWQVDLAIRREFPIYENLKLQFRAEAFNLFNHANFGHIDPFLGSGGFGQADKTLAQSGVLSPLYQAGGPRSMQFALKLVF